MTSTEKFFKEQKDMPDEVLLEKVDQGLSKLCESRGKGFTMHVPPQVDDFDMLISELLRRFKKTIDELDKYK